MNEGRKRNARKLRKKKKVKEEKKMVKEEKKTVPVFKHSGQ